MPRVTHLEVFAYGDRNFPVARVKVPEHLVSNYDALLAAARTKYPDYTDEQLLRYVWRAGLDRAWVAHQQGRLPDPGRTT